MTERPLPAVNQMGAHHLASILNAWTVPGPQPEYHRAMQERLRREWPVLANALDHAARDRARGAYELTPGDLERMATDLGLLRWEGGNVDPYGVPLRRLVGDWQEGEA